MHPSYYQEFLESRVVQTGHPWGMTVDRQMSRLLNPCYLLLKSEFPQFFIAACEYGTTELMQAGSS